MTLIKLGAVAFQVFLASSALAGETTYEIIGDAAKGEKIFKKCKACHAVGDGAKARVGPTLNGLLGRVAGSEDEFVYSDAMQKAGAGGLVWEPETLAAFLEKPKAYVDGTKMSFAGLRKDEDRADIIAYLATF